MRKDEYTLVGWCDECEMYVEPWVAGMTCPGDHEEHPRGFKKWMRKRRMYICEHCFEGDGFLSLSTYEAHVQEYHEVEA